VWGINEDDIKFLYVMKSTSLEDIRFREPKVSKCQTQLSMQALFNFLLLGDDLGISGANRKRRRRRRNLFEFSKTNYALYKHLRACTNFVEMYSEWA
jgi:hypothetical protein